MPFKAAEVIEQLSYDFRPFVDAKGVTVEPSDEQIRLMLDALQKATRDKLGEDFDPADTEAAMKVMKGLTNDQLAEIDEETMEAVSLVTKDSPSLAVLKTLPARVKRQYFGSLMADLLPPTASPSGTSG